jgi:hypothetical protein
MANIDQPFGLRPIAKVGSAPGGTTGTTKYRITSGAGAMFTGDIVKQANDGSVVQGTAGDAARGVFMGCFYTDPSTSKPRFNNTFPNGTAASDAIAFVADDPDQLFIAQQDSVSANAVVADLNLNANLIVGSGNTTTGISGMEIDSDSKNTTATLNVKLIDFYDVPSNDATANNSILVVKINNHELGSHTGTAGL